MNEAAWAQFVAVHHINDVVDGEVVSVVPSGAFIRIGGGVDDLTAVSVVWNSADCEQVRSVEAEFQTTL